MKLLKHSLGPRVFWLPASFRALLISSPLPGLHAQKCRDDTKSVTRWEYSDTGSGLKRRLESRGTLDFNDDYTDVESVSEGGRVIFGSDGFSNRIGTDLTWKIS